MKIEIKIYHEEPMPDVVADYILSQLDRIRDNVLEQAEVRGWSSSVTYKP